MELFWEAKISGCPGVAVPISRLTFVLTKGLFLLLLVFSKLECFDFMFYNSAPTRSEPMEWFQLLWLSARVRYIWLCPSTCSRSKHVWLFSIPRIWRLSATTGSLIFLLFKFFFSHISQNSSCRRTYWFSLFLILN